MKSTILPLISLLFLNFFVSFDAAADFQRNYLDPKNPLYVQNKQSDQKFLLTSSGCSKSLKVVTYNLHFSKKMAQVIDQFLNDPELKDADLIILQEVVGAVGSETAHSAHQLATALGHNYAYAPAFIHPKNDLDFGVAIVSRFNLRDVTKIILPHVHFQAKTQRVAIGATLDLPCSSPLRIYSAHLETLQFSQWRIDQAQEIVQDALLYWDAPVLIGGDFNSAPFWQRWLLVRNLKKSGLSHLTEKIGATMKAGPIKMKLDLFFAKGLKPIKVKKAKKTYSDHSPIVLSFTQGSF